MKWLLWGGVLVTVGFIFASTATGLQLKEKIDEA